MGVVSIVIPSLRGGRDFGCLPVAIEISFSLSASPLRPALSTVCRDQL
jgi:hypothetical protein